jgi:hypothetical protein
MHIDWQKIEKKNKNVSIPSYGVRSIDNSKQQKTAQKNQTSF